MNGNETRSRPEKTGVAMALVTGIRDALTVRAIRNQCYESLTANASRIGFMSQVRWYYTKYRNLVRSSRYRLFLFRSEQGLAIGYGALRLDDERLLVTVGVRENSRGQGYGGILIKALIDVAKAEGRPLVADIWADNEASVRMCEGAGLTLESSRTSSDRDLGTYVIR